MFCRGCRSCHNTAKCIMSDASVLQNIMDEYDVADIIVSVSPSYWADVPGQCFNNRGVQKTDEKNMYDANIKFNLMG